MKVINLLPKIRQEEIRYLAVLKSVRLIVVLSLISYGLVFLSQLGTRLYLEGKSNNLKTQIETISLQIKKQENSQVKAKVKAVNDLVSDFKNLADASPEWSKVIKAFVVLPPDGVKINNFTVDPNKKLINITGFSPTRAQVIELYNNILADEKNFYNVDYPLENVAQPRNVYFHFTFSIKDELLK